ncbi:MAG: nucleotidyl transferase AbiEii/AbiGii toxin family protein [Candidatus Firestonebacteria bacterium]
MITMESLLDEAEKMKLPLNKKRAILREYIQSLTLNYIFKSEYGKKLFFAGGTALRFVYNIPRFSQDLDFNAKGLGYGEFSGMIVLLKDKLDNEGFNVEYTRKDIYDVLSAKITFKEVMKQFGLTDKIGLDIMIKIETNVPKWKIKHEVVAVSKFGQLFTAQIMDKGSFLAEKSHAFIHRCRGRDVYDIIFLLKNKFPLDPEMFKNKEIQGEPKEALLKKFKGLKKANMKSLVNQVMPFLFKEEEIEYVKKAVFYGPELLKQYDTSTQKNG